MLHSKAIVTIYNITTFTFHEVGLHCYNKVHNIYKHFKHKF